MAGIQRLIRRISGTIQLTQQFGSEQDVAPIPNPSLPMVLMFIKYKNNN